MPTKTTVVRTAATSGGDTMNVKIRCGEDVRRLLLDVAEMDLEQLMARLTTMFNLDGMNHSGSFRIKYQDDEGDLVSVTDDEELQAAFALAKGWGACPRPLRACPPSMSLDTSLMQGSDNRCCRCARPAPHGDLPVPVKSEQPRLPETEATQPTDRTGAYRCSLRRRAAITSAERPRPRP
jgi:hypothetical protein